jgi:hypothetical protein
MHEYRLTKYDPALRDAAGAFKGDDWTAVSDIGESFSGIVLTRQEYDRVEQAHIHATLTFLKEGGIESLRVEELETQPDSAIELREGTVLSTSQLGDVIGSILREEFWCNLESANGFVHFGYDYYIYLGVPHRCPGAELVAANLGLFAEYFGSSESGRTTGNA